MASGNSGSLRRNSGYLDSLEAGPELELYEELNVFTDLTPEERLQRSNLADLTFRDATPQDGLAEGMGFDVVEMSKTRPLVQRPSKPEPTATTACPACGTNNTAGVLFCEGCGGFLDDATSAAPAASRGQVNCGDCGVEVQPDELFCPSCGSILGNE